jgi:hypothetical protein
LAACVAVGLAGSVYRMPIQVDDSLDTIIRSAGFESVRDAFVDGMRNSKTILRPLKQVQTKLLLDLGERLDDQHAAFRGYHALLAALLIVLFTSLAGARSWPGVAALAFALAVLIGMPTFTGLLREAYPVNHFLLVAIYGLALLAIARSRGGWIADIAAVVVFVAATLTLESGILLLPIALAGYIAGLRGISRWGVAAIVALTAGYIGLRAGYLGMEGAALGERATGFGASMLSSADQIERFSDNPLPLYVYNIAMAAISVVLSQPEMGQWTIVEAWRDGEVPPVFWLSILTSLATTALIGWYLLTRGSTGLRRWREPVPFVFLALLASNAIVSYAYAKVEVVSLAGVFYALVAFLAMSELLQRPLARSRARTLAVAAALAILASGWAMRSAGLHFKLRHGAFDARGGWAAVLSPAAPDEWPRNPRLVALLLQLKEEALTRRNAAATALPRGYQQWWGED